jgi:3-oxoacyl-[acyl-carrier protein] reductase
MGNAMQSNYAAGKAGIVGLTKSLAKEWGPLRINVNAVAFGFIDTRLTAANDAGGEVTPVNIGSRSAQLGVPEATRSMVEMFTPLGKLGSVNDAAGPIAFLCSPWSDYITGQVLTVSGGLPFGMSS